MRVYLRKWKDEAGRLRDGKPYWVLFYVGGRRHHVSLKTRDKRAAELLAAQRVRREEMKRAGITSGFEDHDERPIEQHVRAFLATIRARGVVPKYIADREKCLRAYVGHRGAEHLKDIDLAGANAWLTELRATGLSHRSVNSRYAALAQFGRWLVTARRWAHDPFDGLKPLNEAEDQRHVRRALTPEEAERLIRAAEQRPLRQAEAERIHAGVTPAERERLLRLGQTRALCWSIMLGTGLRTGEVRRLRWQDVRDGVVHVPAASAKARRDQGVPMPTRLAEMLAAYRPRDARPAGTVIPAGLFPNGLTFDRDLRAAGIEKRDGSDRVADRHALRHTYVTWIVAGGAPQDHHGPGPALLHGTLRALHGPRAARSQGRRGPPAAARGADDEAVRDGAARMGPPRQGPGRVSRAPIRLGAHLARSSGLKAHFDVTPCTMGSARRAACSAQGRAVGARNGPRGAFESGAPDGV